MKHIHSICILVFSLTIVQGAIGRELSPYTPQGGALTFDLPDIKGEQHSLNDYRGRVLLVNFWASWCPPCIQEIPSLKRLRQKLEDQPFEVLAINAGERKYKVWKFAKLVSLDLPILLDSDKDTFRSWGVRVLPTSFLIDADGQVRYRVQGDLEWDSDEIVEQISTLINEQETTE